MINEIVEANKEVNRQANKESPEKNIIKIRTAASSDYDDWCLLWNNYQVFYKVKLSDEVTNTTWKRLLDPNEPMHLALAEVDGKVVGFTHYIEHRTTWAINYSVYLQDLYVFDNLRGRKIGRALIEHVYEYGKKIGTSKVHWLTHNTNSQAIILYDKVATKSGYIQYLKTDF